MLMASSVQAQNLFVTEIYNAGSTYEITPSGVKSTFVPGLNGIGLAFDSAGDLFVARRSLISEVTPNGNVSVFTSSVAVAYALAFNSAGDLFVSDSGSGCIYEFTRNGLRSTFASGLGSPTFLTFNRAGDLFVPDFYSGNIYEFTPSGVKSTFASGLDSPNGLAFDSAGNLFVANWGGTISEFGQSGNLINASFATGLNHPYAVAINGADDVFVADSGSGKIYEYTPSGVKSTFASGLIEAVTGLAFQPVPEPSALGLLVVGATAFLVRRRQQFWKVSPNSSPKVTPDEQFGGGKGAI